MSYSRHIEGACMVSNIVTLHDFKLYITLAGGCYLWFIKS